MLLVDINQAKLPFKEQFIQDVLPSASVTICIVNKDSLWALNYGVCKQIYHESSIGARFYV